jgi:hypothetical protein
MTWEQLSLFTDEELGIQSPGHFEKTVAIQLSDLREEIAQDIEKLDLFSDNALGIRMRAAAVARGIK